jgi:hypothetical protein
LGKDTDKHNTKLPVTRQIIDLIPSWLLRSCIQKYQSDKYTHRYKTYDQLVTLSFGQLNKSESLSGISSGIGINEKFIEDLKLTQSPARSTMSDGNKKRDWRVFEHLYNRLLSHYKSVLKKHHKSHIIEEVKGKVVKLIDSSTISLCLTMFDWAVPKLRDGQLKEVLSYIPVLI